MIILDTNVISELMKPSPSSSVLNWISNEDSTELFITTITIGEIVYGIHTLPDGNRRNALEIAFDKTIKKTFRYRILSFDETSSHSYGKIMSHRKKLGKPFSILDGQIAAIAQSQHATLATRNIRDFVDCELTLINPFC